MKVVDGLAAVGAGVDDEAVAAIEVMGAGEVAGGGEEGAEEGGVFGEGVGVGGDVAFWNEEEVGRRLGVDVGEGEDVGGFVKAFGGDGSGDDLAEEAVGVCIRHVGDGTPGRPVLGGVYDARPI